MACQITYKNKKYGYEDFMSLLADGEFKSLVENGSIDVSKLKGEYEDALPQRKTEKILQREQEEVGETRGQRGRVEQREQGEEVAKESKEEEIKFSFIAWHGSPHEFDKFSTEKIGTGEGAQAFGWGLYFTDVKDIARYYAEKILPFNAPSLIYSVALTRAIEAGTGVEIGKMTDRTKFDKQKALDFINNDRGKSWSKEIKEWVLNIIENEDITKIGRFIYKVKILQNKKGYAIAPLQSLDQKWNVYSNEMMDKINSLQNKQGVLDNLKDYPPIKRFDTKDEAIKWISENTEYNWIEWDKPLTSDQKKAIKDQLYKEFGNNNLALGLSVYELGEKSLTEGDAIYRAISRLFRIKQSKYEEKDASLFLLRAGIDGIKYPAESLSGKPARGFNYVVFDENAVTIEEQIKFSLADELTEVKSSLDNLVKEGVYTKGQVDGLIKKVEDNFNKLQEQGKPTSADVSFAYLMELIKAKGEKEGKQLSNKAYKALAKEILGNLKKLLSAKEKQFVTPTQYNAIIRKITNATTDKARQKAIDYVNETVIFGKGAKFKAQLSEARNNLKKIKDANRSDKSKFGTARKLADEVEGIDVSQLDYDELREFNHLANRIFTTKALPNTKPLILLHGLFGQVQKEPKQKDEKIKTVDELIEYIESAKEMYELVSEDGNIVFDLPSYIYFKRMLNYARKRAVDLFSELADTKENQSKRQQLEELIGSIEQTGEEKAGLIKEQMEEFRQEFAARTTTRLRSKETEDGINEIENKYLRLHTMMFYETPSEVIQKLEMKDLLALNSAIDNLRESQVLPEMLHDLQIRMNVQRKIDKNFRQAYENISKSKLWKDFVKRGFKGIIPELRNLAKGAKEVEELERYLMSKQAFRIDTALGNFSLRHTVGKAFTEPGTAINKATNHKEKIEKELQKAYAEFTKGKRKGKFIFRYAEDEQQLWRRFVGMYLIERRWQESDSFKDNFDNNNASILNFVFNLHPDKMLPDSKKEFDKDKEYYQKFIEYLRENNALTVKDGVEIIDLPKADALLRSDKGIDTLINAIDKAVTDLKGINEVAALFNNRSLEWRPNYVPFVRKDSNNTFTDENVFNLINKISAGTRMEAGATHEWTEQKMYIETDIVKSINGYVDDVLRNYYVAPILRENRMALNEASKLSDDKDIRYLGNALVKTLVDRVAMYYRTGIYRHDSRILNRLETGSKKALLAKLSKTIVETVANVERMIFSMGKIPFEAWDRIRINSEVWNQIIADNIGESAFTRWADEIDDTVFKKTILKKGEELADWMIVYADKTVGRPIFAQHFLDTFRKETGRDFDEEQYKTNEKYRLNNADAINASAMVGLRRTEELFNNKNPLSQPQLISFLGGLMKGVRNNVFVRAFNYLMSFGRNETNQLIDSVRRMRYGNTAERLMGTRDIISLVLSNFSYGVLRTYSSYLEARGLSFLANLFTQSGGDDDKYIDEKKQQIHSGKFYIDFATMKLLPDLVIGGNSNVVEWTGTMLLYMFEKTQNISPEKKEWIYEVYKRRYVDILSMYGSADRALIAATPAGFQPVLKDAFSLAESVIDTKAGLGTIYSFITALDDAQKEGLLTEKEVYDIINIANIGTKYFGFNPLVPYIERQMNQRMWLLRKEAAKEKKDKQKGKKSGGATTTVNY